MTSIWFLATCLIVVASPGTGALYTIATGISRGGRASVVAAFGCTLGIVPHLIAAIAGVAAMLHASALAFQSVKVVGVVYLMYMAWVTARERGALSAGVGGAVPVWRTVARAVLINLLNPKLSIFFVAFLPQFIASDEVLPVHRMLGLSAVFMLMTFVVFAAYGLFAAAMRDRVLARPRVLAWLRRMFAAAFVGLGVRLALAEP